MRNCVLPGNPIVARRLAVIIFKLLKYFGSALKPNIDDLNALCLSRNQARRAAAAIISVNFDRRPIPARYFGDDTTFTTSSGENDK